MNVSQLQHVIAKATALGWEVCEESHLTRTQMKTECYRLERKDGKQVSSVRCRSLSEADQFLTAEAMKS